MDGFQFEIKTPEMFNLDLMLDCGQAFRWEKDEHGNMRGVVSGKQYTLKQDGDILYCSCTEADFNDLNIRVVKNNTFTEVFMIYHVTPL